MGGVEGDMTPMAADMRDGDLEGEEGGIAVVWEGFRVCAELEYSCEELDRKHVYGRHV